MNAEQRPSLVDRVCRCLAASLVLCAVARPSPGSDVSMQKLPNGLTLIVEPATESDVVAVYCAFSGGARYELDREQGLTNLTMRTMARATTRRDSQRLSERVESMGASLSAGAGDDTAFVSMICVREDTKRMLDLMREVVFQPAFDQDDMDKERESVIAGIKRSMDNSFQYTYREFLNDLYHGHPYARDPRGQPDILRSFVREHLVQRHEEVCRMDQACMSVVGNVDPEALGRALEKWPAPTAPGRARFRSSKTFARRAEQRTIEKQSEQAFIVTGYHAVTTDDPDFPALRVASAALGEGMSSRLFVALRDRRSLAYAVGSVCVTRFDQGHLACYIGTNPQNASAALDGIFEQIALMRDEFLAPHEIERARNYVIGKFQLAQQSNSARAQFRATWYMSGLGLNFDERYPEMIRKVEPEAVRFACRKYLHAPTTVTLKPKAASQIEP